MKEAVETNSKSGSLVPLREEGDSEGEGGVAWRLREAECWGRPECRGETPKLRVPLR